MNLGVFQGDLDLRRIRFSMDKSVIDAHRDAYLVSRRHAIMRDLRRHKPMDPWARRMQKAGLYSSRSGIRDICFWIERAMFRIDREAGRTNRESTFEWHEWRQQVRSGRGTNGRP